MKTTMEVNIQSIEEALEQGQVHFEHKTLKNRDGTRLRARSNGMLTTWKTRPNEFKLPCKHGLKDCFYITEFNAHEWEIV